MDQAAREISSLPGMAAQAAAPARPPMNFRRVCIVLPNAPIVSGSARVRQAIAPWAAPCGYIRIMQQIISSDSAPKAIGPYSQAVVYNRVAYLTGQIPLDPATGQMVAGDIAAQTERVLENLKAVLAATGSALERVTKPTVYLNKL